MFSSQLTLQSLRLVQSGQTLLSVKAVLAGSRVCQACFATKTKTIDRLDWVNRQQHITYTRRLLLSPNERALPCPARRLYPAMSAHPLHLVPPWLVRYPGMGISGCFLRIPHHRRWPGHQRHRHGPSYPRRSGDWPALAGRERDSRRSVRVFVLSETKMVVAK